ncbi:PREDICTED: protein PLASTID MOVEMENT IMPAIRED 1-RELATED 1 isoform X2 [Tarenaya hassleriana]|uniref:protein PLASTID MOVEMENT IMPAIRED 1-RELATED 1 isoform X1 n=1 Tax=Tarenaya hassleriana TaxID=28532 RepID=UPI00053C2AFC|nr:PREDICTED: protein PLASTID MOVEMENT IMPAIRED 1-RELATED 1 isoform X1 [Tarenaya hassleriana]XP_019056336.1 PREDICTED: protein PLASTID MOVEMENT IMPAIRED 1-RELATED 1 isoform X2 [Tarenaya hassleriana]
MLSKHETGKKRVGEGGESSSSLKFLKEVETLSRALYPDKNPRSSVNDSNNVPSKSSARTHSSESQKEKKSIWNWPLRALSHVRNRRFNCCFSLQVHSIEGMPSIFQDVYLTVHLKRRDESLSTRPAKVLNGTAKFEEKLMYTCSVYGSRNGPHHSAKYEAKHFLLYASAVGSPEVDLGKHRMDLTKLLPLTLEELQEEKSSGKWSTTFQLTGKAKGATLNVSFGYTVVGDTRNTAASMNIQNVRGVPNPRQNSNYTAMTRTSSIKSGQGNEKTAFRRYESLPSVVNKDPPHALPRNVEDIKDLHEVLPIPHSDLASSVSILYQKFDEEKADPAVESQSEIDVVTKHIEPVESISCEEDDADAQKVTEPSVIGHETEAPFEVFEKVENFPDSGNKEVAEVGTAKSPVEDGIKLDQKDEEIALPMDDAEQLQGHTTENDERYAKETIMEELESALKNVELLETEALDPEEDQENYAEAEEINSITPIKGVISRNSSDVTDSVASEFLNMLGIEHSPFGLSFSSEPESPRERLLREFEKETLAIGSSLFDFNIEDDEPQMEYDEEHPEEAASDFEEDFDLASIIHDIEEEFQWETQERIARPRAKVLEDFETEALMREWGMNEKTFQNSPPHNGDTGFHPVGLPPEEPLQLPPLGEGLGPVVQTKNGGFLRSMNPSLFRNSKAGGSLIMQVSTPVVVPAEMGSGIMDTLQRLAIPGIEKLSMQANKLMPLDDVTGKTMQELVWETSPAINGAERDHILETESAASGYERRPEGRSSSGARARKFSSVSGKSDVDSEYVSLEDLAPLAMDQIEELALEGLRIQSGMSDEDAPSNITAQSIGEISAFHGKKSGSLGFEGAVGLQLLNVKDHENEDADGLMSLSLTLDEWMKLDSGEIGDEDEISERTSKILAAHHANPLEFVRKGSKGERRKGKGGRKCGLLGNNFTVALMVQLRDPLRNYEPVGAPMLSLIQVERVFVPPKPRIYSTVSELRKDNDEEEEEEEGREVKDETREEKVVVPQYKISEVHLAGTKSEPGKKLWGNTNQQQAGSRWLVANGMGKVNKNPFLKSKPNSAKPSGGETLWSVSSRGSGAKWKDSGKVKPHVRNPNFIMPK